MLDTSPSIQNLEDVFITFNKISSELHSSYSQLEQRVSILNDELAMARSAKLKELQAKEQLADKLSALMQALPGGIVVINQAGIVIEENQAAGAILEQSVLGQKWSEMLGCNSTADSEFIDREYTLNNGRRISLSSKPYGEQNETIILIQDITEKHRLSKQINRDKRLSAMGEMTGRLAHQIRTPLASAILYLSHLNQNGNSDNSDRLVKKIKRRMSHIEQLISAMLQYIREGINTSEELCLHELLNDVVDSMQQEIRAANGTVSCHFSKAHAPIRGNRVALSNAIVNLIENSLAANPKAAEIKLNLDEVADYFIIQVEDNGPGIADHLKEQVFDPFFSTKVNGTGLGLPIVLSTVKSHRGDIAIFDAENGGAIFEISIPSNLQQSFNNGGMWETSQAPTHNTTCQEKESWV